MPKRKNYGVSKFQTGKKIIPGEALAFKHLDSEVTTVKVAFFREALIEVALASGFARPRPWTVVWGCGGNPSRSSPLPNKNNVLNDLNSGESGETK